jgi:hypothetical protein
MQPGLLSCRHLLIELEIHSENITPGIGVGVDVPIAIKIGIPE